MIAAIECGYRHIDCAELYGNEKEIGEGLQDVFDRGVVKREDLWITSKLWNTHRRPEHVRPALKKTLSELRMYVRDVSYLSFVHAFNVVILWCICIHDLYLLLFHLLPIMMVTI